MDTQTITCPYCGEPLTIAIDVSVRRQEYIEDCQICCRPITLTVERDDGAETTYVEARSEDT
ncbi:MAG: CPXCG motif-containing cysteine-rich protein [Acidobacteriota bacterium]|nr:CPXCG motif-containing cysteine-rich protein [Acidobacteriota bacterium]